MQKPKKVRYTNEYGQTIEFLQERPLYADSIDCSQLEGIFATEKFSRANGQKTIKKQVGARAITLQGSYYDEEYRDFGLVGLQTVFSPLVSGTLEIETDWHTYTINCYPAAVPLFTRASDTPAIIKFTVVFQSDEPFFRMGAQHEFHPTTGTTSYIESETQTPAPVEIVFPAGVRGGITSPHGAVIRLDNSAGSTDVIINTEDFSIKDTNGADKTALLDPTADIWDMMISPGTTEMQFGNTDIYIRWYDLAVAIL